MKILYVAKLAAGETSGHRRLALERLGHRVVTCDLNQYVLTNPWARTVAFRLAMGPHATRLNRDVLELARREKPDILWADKALLLTPKTLDAVRGMGILSVSYMIDNAFGPRRDPGWRMYVKCIPHYDLHVTQRDASVTHYLERGARDVLKIQTAYEPTIQFPPPVPLSDAERDRDVSFIGTPYDNRAEVMKLVADAGLPVAISGNPKLWKRALTGADYARMVRTGNLWDNQYREAIWHSKINLSFLTKSNQDEYTHKSFEIAGCGGFLMAERCPGHSAKFKEDEEAVFFSDTEELIAKIRRYLPDEAARVRIAAAGHERAVRDGYYNDVQEARILDRLTEIAARRGGG